jgi:ribonuclease P protein component
VSREGKRVRTEHLDLRVVASLLRHPRVGFIVPKYGRTSVERNRLKRRLRELVRREMLGRIPSLDVTIRARREAYDVPFDGLSAEITAARDRMVSMFRRA